MEKFTIQTTITVCIQVHHVIVIEDIVHKLIIITL